MKLPVVTIGIVGGLAVSLFFAFVVSYVFSVFSDANHERKVMESKYDYSQNKADFDTEHWEYTPCSIILSPSVAEAHIGACFRDYWREYSKCSPVGSIFGSGCIILQGEMGAPWCYPENCT